MPWSWVRLSPAKLGAAIAIAFAIVTGSAVVVSDVLILNAAPNRVVLTDLHHIKGILLVTLMSVILGFGASQLEKRSRLIRRLTKWKEVDDLTGLPTRTVVEEILTERCKASLPSGVLLVDISGTQRINRALGRLAGDLMLRETACRIAGCVSAGEVVARLESDHFAIALPQPANEGSGIGVGVSIAKAVEEPIVIDGVEAKVTANIGLAMFPRDGATAQELLDAAERALHRSRKMRSGPTVVSGPGDEEHRNLYELESALRRAIRAHTLTIALQPQIDVRTNRIIGSESLVRWIDPVRGPIPPAEFIPLAESLGLVAEITKDVLRQSTETWANWRRQGARPTRLSVNLSALDLDNEHIIEVVLSCLRRADMPAPSLVLEITETALSETPTAAAETIVKLRDLGVEIAVDDFGTGYSSLGQLVNFRVDHLKIDRSLVAGAPDSKEKAVVLRAIQRMASALRCSTLAEGVGTEAELDLVRRLGVREAQGYFIGKPTAPDDFFESYLVQGSEMEKGGLGELITPATG